MKRLQFATLAVVAAATLTASLALPATAITPGYMKGYVVHVSSENIKVESLDQTQSLSFLVVPKFKQVFSADGKTTYQMAVIKPGMIVKVQYDQKALGARHADKIWILDAKGQALTGMKS
jgi:hypothetical protein